MIDATGYDEKWLEEVLRDADHAAKLQHFRLAHDAWRNREKIPNSVSIFDGKVFRVVTPKGGDGE